MLVEPRKRNRWVCWRKNLGKVSPWRWHVTWPLKGIPSGKGKEKNRKYVGLNVHMEGWGWGGEVSSHNAKDEAGEVGLNQLILRKKDIGCIWSTGTQQGMESSSLHFSDSLATRVVVLIRCTERTSGRQKWWWGLLPVATGCQSAGKQSHGDTGVFYSLTVSTLDHGS